MNILAGHYKVSKEALELELAKIPRTKSRQAIEIKKAKEIREKEQGWNQRHHVQPMGRYPNPSEVFPGVLKSKIKQKQIAAKAKRKNQSLQRPEIKVNRKHNVDQLYKQAIRNALHELQVTWEKFDIPDFHAQLFSGLVHRLSDYQFALDKIKLEHESIKKGQSPIQTALQQVRGRQNSLKAMREFCEKGSVNIQIFADKLVHLRKYTVSTVQSVYAWRKYLQNMMIGKKITPLFKYESSNYLLKLRTDAQFLLAQPTARQLGLHNRPQPFFGTSGLSKSLIKRIKTCQQILDDQRYLQENMIDKNSKAGLSPKKELKEFKGKRKELQDIIKMRQEEEINSKPSRFFIKQDRFQAWYQDILKESQFSLVNAFGTIKLSSLVELGIIRFKSTYTVIGVDKNFHRRRVVLVNICGKMELQDLSAVLPQIINYIWSEDSATQIRASLFHQKSDQTYAINKLIQATFKGVGFVWRMTNNDRLTGLKVNVMSVKRPQSLLVQNQFHLQIQSIMLLRKSSIGKDLVWLWSDFNELSLKRHAQTLGQQFGPEQLKRIDKIVELNYNGIRTYQFESQNHLLTVCRQNFVRIGALDSFSKNCVGSILNLSFKWINYSYAELKSGCKTRKYVRFQSASDRPLLYANSSAIKAPIYFIPTDEENCTFFVFEAGEVIDLQQARQIVSNLDGDQLQFRQTLWVPLVNKTGVSFSNGIEQHCMLSTDFRTSLYSIEIKQGGKVLSGRLAMGMLNYELVGKLQSALWLSLLQEIDFI